MIVDIREQPLNQGGTANSAVSDQSSVRQWYVIVDSVYDNISTIKNDSRWLLEMPRYGSPHPDDPQLSLKSISLERANGAKQAWYARGEYTAQPFDPDEEEKEQIPNPLDRRTRVTSHSQDRVKYSIEDVNGKPYKNSAGEPYPPQVTTVTDIVFEVNKNISAWHVDMYLNSRTINQNSVTLFDGYQTHVIPAEKGLLSDLKFSDVRRENGIYYYELSARITATNDADGWGHLLADTGFNQRDGDKISRIKVLSETSSGELVPCVTEQYLDGEGMPLYPDGVYNPALNPVYNEFDQYKTRVWDLPIFVG